MRNVCKKVCLLFAMGVVSLGIPLGMYSPDSALAEFYIAGMGGYVVPNDFSDVEGEDTLSGVSFGDLTLKDSAMVGAKIGYYLPKWNWLGVETEAFSAWPDIKAQTVSGGLSTTGTDVRIITWGLNGVVRYPGERIQPYAGAGLGVFFAHQDTRFGSYSDNWVPGLNLLAGIRGFVTDSIALFAEYKYTRATFTFDNIVQLENGGVAGLTNDYSANIVAAGLAYHFN